MTQAHDDLWLTDHLLKKVMPIVIDQAIPDDIKLQAIALGLFLIDSAEGKNDVKISSKQIAEEAKTETR